MVASVNPPACLYSLSTPQFLSHCSGSVVKECASTKNSATSKPIPPAPIIATFLPTGLLSLSTSR